MNKCARVFTALGALLLIAAAALTGYNLWDDARANRAAESAREILAATLPQSTEGPAPEVLPAEIDDPEEVFIPDYRISPEVEMPTVETGGEEYAALLELPALDLSLPVISRWSYAALKTAPCRYSGSAYQGDLVIAGHNYAGHFGRLRACAPGDEVRLTDMDGNVFYYEVAEVEVLAPTAIEEMTGSGYDLTLFTCTVGGRARLTVRCVLLRDEPAA